MGKDLVPLPPLLIPLSYCLFYCLTRVNKLAIYPPPPVFNSVPVNPPPPEAPSASTVKEVENLSATEVPFTDVPSATETPYASLHMSSSPTDFFFTMSDATSGGLPITTPVGLPETPLTSIDNSTLDFSPITPTPHPSDSEYNNTLISELAKKLTSNSSPPPKSKPKAKTPSSKSGLTPNQQM